MDYRIRKDKVKDMDDENLFWAIIEPIWPDENVRNELKYIAKGTPGQRAIYSITVWIREVDNGGLEQFYYNSTGDYIEEVVKGLKLIGAEEHLRILQESFKLFLNKLPPTKRKKRLKILKSMAAQEIEELFTPIEVRLFGEQRLFQYFKEYINKHPEDFFKD